MRTKLRIVSRTRRIPQLRQLVVYGLILLALTLLSAVGYVIATGRGRTADDAEAWREDVVVNSASAPTLEFPERRRTYNSGVNRLIDRFIRTTQHGQYSEFRKMWTRRLDPISADAYERIYSKVRAVRVLDVRPAAGPAGAKDTAYILTAEVHVADTEKREQSVRTVRIAVQREDDEWVFAPVAKPSGDAERNSDAPP